MNYTILDNGTLREITTRDVSAGRQFDVVMIGPYETPQFGKDGHITDLTRMASSDRAYKLDDIIPSVRNALSSRQALLVAVLWRIVLPDVPQGRPGERRHRDAREPTWTQVAEIARKIDTPDRAGICLRGKPAGRPRRHVHHRAEHVRWNVVVREAGRLGG